MKKLSPAKVAYFRSSHLPEQGVPDTAEWARRLLYEVWNGESPAAAFEIVPPDFQVGDLLGVGRRRGPLVMLDLVHLYKSCIADLKFVVRRQLRENSSVATYWIANGRFSYRALGHARVGKAISLQGSFVAEGKPKNGFRISENSWDVATFAASIDASMDDVARALEERQNEIRLRVFPDRGGVPIVLFPTLSLPGWIGWRRLIGRMQHRRQLVTFQLLGNRWALNGYRGLRGYSVNRETTAVEAVLGRSGVRRPFDVVAHSAGGCIALDFAIRNPGAIRSLTLIEPALAWVLEAGKGIDGDIKRFIARRKRVYRKNISEDEYAEFIQQAMPAGERVDPRASPYWPDVSIYRDNMKYRLPVYRHRDRLDRISALSCPVLLVQGRHSDRFHHSVIDILRSHFPRSRIVEMRGGHSPHLGDGLRPFVRHLNRFLREID